ncbi:MAG: beta-lactamase family protein [Spirochaetes bacterium]|nr:beta-lactamase family protein [Spirochaetota bacterium]
MQYILTELVNKDKMIRNCVLSVAKGDGSFSWSGAAGFADQQGTPMSKDTPVCIASITKMYTASLILILHEKGLLSLDDPISKYLPEKLIRSIHVYESRDYSHEITVRQLLSHTSGVPDYYSEKPENGKSFFELFLEEPDKMWTVEDTIRRAAELKPNFHPGKGASYSDTNFQLLGKIIESATKKPLHIAYEQYIFHPLGLKHTWLTGHPTEKIVKTNAPADIFHSDINISQIRNNGTYWADGGIISTVNEMIIFLKALNNGKIVKKDTLKSMHDWHKLEFPMQYGYGTMYFKFPGFINVFMKLPPLWGHSGSTGSFLYYSEDLDLFIAGTVNQTASQMKPFMLISKVIKAIKSDK